MVRLLIANGADVNTKTKDVSTALMFAADRGYYDIVKVLLANGADVNAIDKRKNGKRNTALMHASSRDHYEILKELIANGADVNAKAKNHETALMFAANHGHCEILKELIANGADVNAKAKDHETALIFAAYHGHYDIVKVLLANGADVNVINKWGMTALMFAYLKGHYDIVIELAQRGYDINLIGFDGKSVSEYYEIAKKRLEKAKYLSDKLKKYEIGALTIEQFINDGWNAGDAWLGMIGVIKLNRDSEQVTFALGYCDLNNEEGANNAQEMYDITKAALRYEDIPINYNNVASTSGEDVSQIVCILIFKNGLLDERILSSD